jgi:hypothetical protein
MTPDYWHGVYTKQRTAAVSNDLCFSWLFVRKERTIGEVLKIAEILSVTVRAS